jgi:hypothetical protein
MDPRAAARALERATRMRPTAGYKADRALLGAFFRGHNSID